MLIEVVAAKRSAHHAFLLWLGDNYPRSLVFYNNVWPSVPPRLAERRIVHASLSEIDAIHGRDLLQVLREVGAPVLVNFEGRSLASIDWWEERYLREGAGEVRRLLFLRDPLSNVASLAARVQRPTGRAVAGIFAQILAMQSYIEAALAAPKAGARTVVPLVTWQEDASFRMELAGELGLCASELPRTVSLYGGGSSFAQQSFADAGERRALYRRWTAALDEPLFLAPFTDAAFVAAARAYVERIGHGLDVTAADLERVVSAARAEPAADRLRRRTLVPLRRARHHLEQLEREPRRPVREWLRLRSKFAMLAARVG